jgi:hypothetical protein
MPDVHRLGKLTYQRKLCQHPLYLANGADAIELEPDGNIAHQLITCFLNHIVILFINPDVI